jgi:hypothetical protein
MAANGPIVKALSITATISASVAIKSLYIYFDEFIIGPMKMAHSIAPTIIPEKKECQSQLFGIIIMRPSVKRF